MQALLCVVKIEYPYFKWGESSLENNFGGENQLIMTLKETAIQRSCSDELTASEKLPRNHFTGSLMNCSRRSESFTQRLAGNIESRLPKREASKNILNKHSLATISQNKLPSSQKKQTGNPTNSCYCPDCAAPEDVPKHHLQELEQQLQSLKMELSKVKNNNQVLRRSVLVAKKVLKTEIGHNEGDFDSLLKKATEVGWKGRQETIFALKRKLRDLNEAVERMETDTKPQPCSKRSRPKTEESPEIILDERKVHWCLELERKDVLKNAERYKQKIITSRNSMKDALESLINREEEVTKEVSFLREKLSAIPKNMDEELVKRLREVENKLKINLDEKADGRCKLDELEQQICRNCRTDVELKAKLTIERKIAKNKESMLNSLKMNEGNLRLLSEELNKEKRQQAVLMKNKLEYVLQDYSKTAILSDKILVSIADSKQLLEKSKAIQDKNPADNLDTKKSCSVSNIKEKKGMTYSQPNTGNGSKLPAAMVGDNTESVANLYENKLSKYKAALDFLEQSNLEKTKKLHKITSKTKEDIVILLKNRYFLWKLISDTNIIKCRGRRFHKVANHPLKQKLVKRKNSSQQLAETLDEVRTHLNVLKIESKFLKTFIKRVFASKEDDCELFEMFFDRNRYHLTKQVSFEIMQLVKVR